jgi:hypothetical protein
MATTSLANSLPGENLLCGRRAQSKLPEKPTRHEKVAHYTSELFDWSCTGSRYCPVVATLGRQPVLLVLRYSGTVDRQNRTSWDTKGNGVLSGTGFTTR